MTFSADIYELAALIASIAFLVLVIALVPALMQFRKTVKAMEDLASESRKSMEILNLLFKKTGEQADDIQDLIKRFKEVGHKFTDLAELVLDNIKSPLISVLSLIFGLEFGLKRLFRRKKEGGSEDERENR